MDDNQAAQIKNVLVADSFKQIDRLKSIFEEIDPELALDQLNISLRQGFVDNDQKIACYTDHQLFERYHRYKTNEKFARFQGAYPARA